MEESGSPDIVIYSYTDEDALRDGVLVDVSKIAPCPINRATRALWDEFTETTGATLSDKRSASITDATRFVQLAELVAKKIQARGLVEGWVVLEDYQGKRIWAMPNEVNGWTIMFPEDY